MQQLHTKQCQTVWPTCSSAPVQTMQFWRWQPSCTITLSMSTQLMILTLLPSLHMGPRTLRLMLHLSLHALCCVCSVTNRLGMESFQI